MQGVGHVSTEVGLYLQLQQVQHHSHCNTLFPDRFPAERSFLGSCTPFHPLHREMPS